MRYHIAATHNTRATTNAPCLISAIEGLELLVVFVRFFDTKIFVAERNVPLDSDWKEGRRAPARSEMDGVMAPISEDAKPDGESKWMEARIWKLRVRSL